MQNLKYTILTIKKLPLKKIQLFIIFLISIICSGQAETYWKTSEIYRANKEPMTGYTLVYMEKILDQDIHVKQHNDSLEFHYPFQKKIKSSELKSISNFKLFDNYNGKLDSVYNVSTENGILKIKFYYLGSLTDKDQFVLDLKKISKEDFFRRIKKIKTEQENIKRKIKAFDFEQLSLNVTKPDYFNEKDLIVLTKNNQSISLKYPSVYFRNEENRKYDTEGLSIEFNDKKTCAAQFNSICFKGLEYLLNKESNKQCAIALLKSEKLTKADIINLFDNINTNSNIKDFTFSAGYNSTYLYWETKNNEVIQLILEDYSNNKETPFIGFNKSNIENTKQFKQLVKSKGKTKIKIYILSKELHEALYSKNFSGLETGSLKGY